MVLVAVSCGYGICFAVKTCDELCDYMFYTQKSIISTLALKLIVSAIFYPWVTATVLLGNRFGKFVPFTRENLLFDKTSSGVVQT